MRVPSPLIVKLELDLNFIPACSSASSALSVIIEVPFKIRFTIAPDFITKGPVEELSIVIEFKVIVWDLLFSTFITHSEH